MAAVVSLHAADGSWENLPDGSQGRVTEYRGVNDLPIAAYLRTPKGNGPFPAVIMIHGGGESREGTYQLGRLKAAPTANFLAQGWAVFSIDFRPRSPFQPIEWGDACQAVAALRALPLIDGERIAMMGGSHGGYNTARAAARCELACAMPCAPAAIDLAEVAKAKAAGFKLSTNLERVLANPPASDAPGAFDEVEKVRCPMLLISGRNDSSSPPSVMEAYAAKLKAAGKEIELYLPDDGPHGFYFGRPAIPETDEAARRAVAFIAKHFGVVAKAVMADFSQAKPVPNLTRDNPSSLDSGLAEQLFRRLDANGDGRIDGAEAASEPGRRFLRRFDKNGDGVVNGEEIGGESSASPTPPADAGKAKSVTVGAESQRGGSALLQSESFQSKALKGPVNYTLYLPPSYMSESQHRYPVVFWLHGGGGGPGDCWKFVEVTDAAIKAGNCPEMLVVGLDGGSRGAGRVGSQYSDWKDGSLPMETVIVKELLSHIDATYRTLATREGRALEGFSMGGHGALHLAFRHPDLFGATTALGPALIMPGDGGNRVQEVYQNGAYKGDEAYWRQHDPLTIAEKDPAALRGKLRIRLITGEAEGNFTHRRTVELSEKLKALRIEHDFIRPGETGHNYVKYYAAMPDAPKFYAKVFGEPAPALTLAAVLRDETALAGAHDIEIRNGIACVAGKGFTKRNLPASGVFPYEAGKGGSLAIVDVKQPTAPKLLWSASTPLAYEDAETVLPLGNDRLLVGTRDLFVFDVSDPAKPKQLGAIKDRPTVDTINGFARLGDTVFAANKLGHIFAVDVSVPGTMKLLGARETRASGELTSPHDAALSGDLLVIVSPEGFGGKSRPGRLAVYRVADDSNKLLPPERWTRVGKLEHPRLAGANRVMTRGAFAYVGSSLAQNTGRADGLRSNVSVIDLTDPAQPKLRGSVDFPDAAGPNGLEVAGNVVFAAGGKTVQAIDVSDPDAPRELSRFTSAKVFSGGQDDAHDLVFHGGHLFVTAQTSHALVVLKVPETLRPFIQP